MRISNSTDWNSKHLQMFAAKARLDEEVPTKVATKIHVVFRPRRGKTSLWPKVYISPYAIDIGMPTKAVDKDYLARQLCWAMSCMRQYAKQTGHTFRMPMPTYCSWAASLPLEKAPQKTVSASRVMEKRLANAKKMTKVWERKTKLADTILHKWHRRVKLYETRLASPPKPKAPRSHYDQTLLDAIAAHDGAAA